MAKTQQSLFETGGDTARPDSGGLLLVSRPDRPLTPAQREFNKLVRKVENLRERLQNETRRLDEALAFYGEHIHPRLKQLAVARKAVVRGLAAFLEGGGLKKKRDRATLTQIIAEQLDEVLQDFVPGEDEDLRALFERIHGVDYETLEQQEVDEVRSQMESMFSDFGIDIDLSDLRPDMDEDAVAAKAAEVADAMREKFEQEEQAFHERPRRKSKKQLEREERMKQVEEARSKSMASIYKQLAKVLHPDLEQDPEQRRHKVTLMQELTVAYRNNDLHTLLRLELEWIAREEGHLDRLTEEKLAIYNQVLKDQISELKEEIASLDWDPRYQPIAVPDGPFGMRWRASDPAEAALLDDVIATMQAAVARLQSKDAGSEVHNLIQEARAQERRRIRIPF
jgi:hypothetical protein